MTLTQFTNTYLITNRAYPSEQYSYYIYPCPETELFFFMAPGQYNSNSNAYTANPNSATAVMPSGFAAALKKDLQVAAANGCAQLTVYIHGLGNYFSDACNELGTYGTNLQNQGYNGLLIGFDWPSYGEYESWKSYASLPYSFPPTNTYGTIRDNINGSVKSFVNLLSMLASICKTSKATLNFICHSEGNYMLMLGLHNLDFTPTAFINQVLSLAADINTGALQVDSYSPPWSGQLCPTDTFVTGTTVYWSSNDDVLPTSEGWTDYHNPDFPNRLGLHGPASFNLQNGIDDLIYNAYGLDCSQVVNRTVMNQDGVPSSITVHSGYFYLTQVLQDMAQTLNGVPPANVANRTSAGAPDGRAYTMELESELLTGPIVPSGKSLERKTPEPRDAS